MIITGNEWKHNDQLEIQMRAQLVTWAFPSSAPAHIPGTIPFQLRLMPSTFYRSLWMWLTKDPNLLCLMICKIITGLNFDNELKEGDIPSLVLSDRKWKTAHTAGNITLDIPKVYHTIIWISSKIKIFVRVPTLGRQCVQEYCSSHLVDMMQFLGCQNKDIICHIWLQIIDLILWYSTLR